MTRDETAEALIAARNALHDFCLRRGSTDGYHRVFDQINAALANHQGAVEALRDLVEFVESIDGKADDFGELKVVARAKAIIAAAGALTE